MDNLNQLKTAIHDLDAKAWEIEQIQKRFGQFNDMGENLTASQVRRLEEKCAAVTASLTDLYAELGSIQEELEGECAIEQRMHDGSEQRMPLASEI
jgi:hypothetical protein